MEDLVNLKLSVYIVGCSFLNCLSANFIIKKILTSNCKIVEKGGGGEDQRNNIYIYLHFFLYALMKV